MRPPIHSSVRVRQACVMLVRLEDHDLPAGFVDDVASLGLLSLRVRHPIPACQRIGIARPIAVFVGSRLRGEDRDALGDAAQAVGATVRRVSPYEPRGELRTWLVDLVFEPGERRVTSTLRPPPWRRHVAG